jgi:hypothetical protein
VENSFSLDLLTSIATFASIVFVILQLRQSVNQEVRELIAEYNTRYLEVTSRIPYPILVENKRIKELKNLSDGEIEKIKRAFFDYFLLCEEQLILLDERTRPSSRRTSQKLQNVLTRLVRDVEMWNRAGQEWKDGIVANFNGHAANEVFSDVRFNLIRNGENNPFPCISALIAANATN